VQPDPTRPEQTRSDPTRQNVRVSALRPGRRHVWFWLNSTRGARPDFVGDTCHMMTRPRNPQPNLLRKMADERGIIVEACSLITVACSLGAASLLLKRKRKHSTWMKKYILGREQYGECNTLLPELAATEVVKCVQYMRMDIEIFEELLSMVAPVIQRKSTKFIYTIIFSVDQLSGRQPGLGLAGGGGAQTPKCNSPPMNWHRRRIQHTPWASAS